LSDNIDTFERLELQAQQLAARRGPDAQHELDTMVTNAKEEALSMMGSLLVRVIALEGAE